MDITYMPMARGFIYLAAVIDWYSRKVLSWRVSITMDVQFCLDAVQEVIDSYGAPETFNTDQGSQFTSKEWTARLQSLGIKISMDGRGRWMDNVFIERLWRSVKYEEIYLREHATIPVLEGGLCSWFDRYNHWRPHEALGNLTPAVIHDQGVGEPTTRPIAA